MSTSKLVDINCNKKQIKELIEKLNLVKTLDYVIKIIQGEKENVHSRDIEVFNIRNEFVKIILKFIDKIYELKYKQQNKY